MLSGVKDILEAFKGDTSAIAENGIRISDKLPVYIPGKMDKGKAIYATAAQEDDESPPHGCVIMKSKETVVVATYEGNVEAATRLIGEVTDRIQELGH